MMPNWNAGWLHGRKVRASYNLLIPVHLKVVEDPIYLRVDSLPQYHLGNTVMEDYIQQNLVYPVTILKDSIIDTVNVLYVVGKDKSISHVALRKEKKQPDAYDYEAMHLVKNLSVSSPAYLKGKPVSMRLFMPVVFDYRLLDTADVKVLRGIGGGCDKEAVRLVKSMPKWKPGIQKGKAVRVSFNLPIKFSF